MNTQHFLAFLWLRWRLLANQMKRGGMVNTILLTMIAVGAVLSAVALFFTTLVVGVLVLPHVSPLVLLYVWDGVVVAFLFSWTLGVMIELQRAEVLSLDRFLHLPVSLKSAFLINYLSSLFGMTMLFFVPAIVALALAQLLTHGPVMLVLAPLLLSFLLMVSALTYQFQGWLAALMTNPRRRRTILVVVTGAFVLVCQLPTLINLYQPWNSGQHEETNRLRQEELTSVREAAARGEITAEERVRREAEIRREHQERLRESNRRSGEQVERIFRIVNLVVPPGWLALGVQAAAEGNALPAAGAALAFTLVGSFSLWRAYRTTLRLYTGQYTSGQTRLSPVLPRPQPAHARTSLLERKVPLLSEQVSAVALMTFRSMSRAPEAKMMLLTVFILLAVFGSLLFTRTIPVIELVQPFLPLMAISTTLFTLVQIVGNQFGTDRSGFRLFVLSAVPRRDILLGKNLAFAPLALGLVLIAATAIQIAYPARLDRFVAILPQFVSMYLVYCLLANLLSIFAPMPIRAGSFKAANPKFVPILLQLVFAFTLPLALLPMLLPLGLEMLLEMLGVVRGVPIGLVLSLLGCVVVVWGYHVVIGWEGRLLQAREQDILEVVTKKTE